MAKLAAHESIRPAANVGPRFRRWDYWETLDGVQMLVNDTDCLEVYVYHHFHSSYHFVPLMKESIMPS